MGVVIKICVKYPGGPTRITGTEMAVTNSHGTASLLKRVRTYNGRFRIRSETANWAS
jgi:hypothetical protein